MIIRWGHLWEENTPTRKLDFKTSRKCLLTLFISCIGLVLIVFPQLSCPVHYWRLIFFNPWIVKNQVRQSSHEIPKLTFFSLNLLENLVKIRSTHSCSFFPDQLTRACIATFVLFSASNVYVRFSRQSGYEAHSLALIIEIQHRVYTKHKRQDWPRDHDFPHFLPFFLCTDWALPFLFESTKLFRICSILKIFTLSFM